MKEKDAFIEAWLERKEGVTALAAAYGIHRKTAHKWIRRYREEGPAGLAERSRATHRSQTVVDPEAMAAVLALREAHPSWGPAEC